MIKSVPGRFFANDPRQISRYYGIAPEIAAAFMEGVTGTHIDNLLARGDFVLSSSGVKCLEFNIAATLGGWRVPLWASLYMKTPIITRFLQENNYWHTLTSNFN
ncbi:MAG: hypothetical protein GY940_07750, partial [bacterium]|nr:hypothetical protein [bacterium]